jgi:hypothetical protein
MVNVVEIGEKRKMKIYKTSTFDKLCEHYIDTQCFHYIEEKKVKNIFTKNQINPKWKHYIEEVDKIVIGISFALKLDHISTYYQPIRMVFNTNLLSSSFQTYKINSNRVYLQTQGIINKNTDPNAYKFESEVPDELFVEGIVSPLNKFLIKTEILKEITDETKVLLEEYHKKHQIPLMRK